MRLPPAFESPVKGVEARSGANLTLPPSAVTGAVLTEVALTLIVSPLRPLAVTLYEPPAGLI